MFTSPLPYLFLVLQLLATATFAQEAPRRVLFLGNSITLHAPAPNIGWEGNWGMAASAIEKDYVHVLLHKWTKENGKTPEVMVKNIAEFERKLTEYVIDEQLKEELAFQADMIILAIGENATAPKNDQEKMAFSNAFDQLLAALKQNKSATIYVRSQFWPDEVKDSLMKAATEKAGCVWVDLERLGADPTNAASAERHFEHAGVAGHPGDKGMQAIADKIWTAIQKSSN
jgi:lysophospholipase L1-like esterase